MSTEQIDPRYVELDSWPTAKMVAAMFEEQLAAAVSVRGALSAISVCASTGMSFQWLD